MSTRLEELPQELRDMITEYATDIPSGALVYFRPGAEASARDPSASDQDMDLSPAGVVLYSLRPYFEISGTSRWSTGDLIKRDLAESKFVHTAENIFTAIPEVASDLIDLALDAQLQERKDVLPNLRRVIWDGRFEDPEGEADSTFPTDPESSLLVHLNWLGSATQKLSRLHDGKPIEFYVYAGNENWSKHTFLPSESFTCWQGSLSGLPRFKNHCTIKVDLKLALEVSEYCQDDINESEGTSGPSQRFCDKLLTVCHDAREAGEGSTIGLYLVLDDPLDEKAKDRLEAWKDDLKGIVNNGGGEDSSVDIDLQVYVGQRPQLSFQYEL